MTSHSMRVVLLAFVAGFAVETEVLAAGTTSAKVCRDGLQDFLTRLRASSGGKSPAPTPGAAAGNNSRVVTDVRTMEQNVYEALKGRSARVAGPLHRGVPDDLSADLAKLKGAVNSDRAKSERWKSDLAKLKGENEERASKGLDLKPAVNDGEASARQIVADEKQRVEDIGKSLEKPKGPSGNAEGSKSSLASASKSPASKAEVIRSLDVNLGYLDRMGEWPVDQFGRPLDAERLQQIRSELAGRRASSVAELEDLKSIGDRASNARAPLVQRQIEAIDRQLASIDREIQFWGKNKAELNRIAEGFSAQGDSARKLTLERGAYIEGIDRAYDAESIEKVLRNWNVPRDGSIAGFRDAVADATKSIERAIAEANVAKKIRGTEHQGIQARLTELEAEKKAWNRRLAKLDQALEMQKQGKFAPAGSKSAGKGALANADGSKSSLASAATPILKEIAAKSDFPKDLAQEVERILPALNSGGKPEISRRLEVQLTKEQAVAQLANRADRVAAIEQIFERTTRAKVEASGSKSSLASASRVPSAPGAAIKGLEKAHSGWEKARADLKHLERLQGADTPQIRELKKQAQARLAREEEKMAEAVMLYKASLDPENDHTFQLLDAFEKDLRASRDQRSFAEVEAVRKGRHPGEGFSAVRHYEEIVAPRNQVGRDIREIGRALANDFFKSGLPAREWAETRHIKHFANEIDNFIDFTEKSLLKQGVKEGDPRWKEFEILKAEGLRHKKGVGTDTANYEWWQGYTFRLSIARTTETDRILAAARDPDAVVSRIVANSETWLYEKNYKALMDQERNHPIKRQGEFLRSTRNDQLNYFTFSDHIPANILIPTLEGEVGIGALNRSMNGVHVVGHTELPMVADGRFLSPMEFVAHDAVTHAGNYHSFRTGFDQISALEREQMEAFFDHYVSNVLKTAEEKNAFEWGYQTARHELAHTSGIYYGWASNTTASGFPYAKNPYIIAGVQDRAFLGGSAPAWATHNAAGAQRFLAQVDEQMEKFHRAFRTALAKNDPVIDPKAIGIPGGEAQIQKLIAESGAYRSRTTASKIAGLEKQARDIEGDIRQLRSGKGLSPGHLNGRRTLPQLEAELAGIRKQIATVDGSAFRDESTVVAKAQSGTKAVGDAPVGSKSSLASAAGANAINPLKPLSANSAPKDSFFAARWEALQTARAELKAAQSALNFVHPSPPVKPSILTKMNLGNKASNAIEVAKYEKALASYAKLKKEVDEAAARVKVAEEEFAYMAWQAGQGELPKGYKPHIEPTPSAAPNHVKAEEIRRFRDKASMEYTHGQGLRGIQHPEGSTGVHAPMDFYEKQVRAQAAETQRVVDLGESLRAEYFGSKMHQLGAPGRQFADTEHLPKLVEEVERFVAYADRFIPPGDPRKADIANLLGEARRRIEDKRVQLNWFNEWAYRMDIARTKPEDRARTAIRLDGVDPFLAEVIRTDAWRNLGLFNEKIAKYRDAALNTSKLKGTPLPPAIYTAGELFPDFMVVHVLGGPIGPGAHNAAFGTRVHPIYHAPGSVVANGELMPPAHALGDQLGVQIPRIERAIQSAETGLSELESRQLRAHYQHFIEGLSTQDRIAFDWAYNMSTRGMGDIGSYVRRGTGLAGREDNLSTQLRSVAHMGRYAPAPYVLGPEQVSKDFLKQGDELMKKFGTSFRAALSNPENSPWVQARNLAIPGGETHLAALEKKAIAFRTQADGARGNPVASLDRGVGSKSALAAGAKPDQGVDTLSKVNRNLASVARLPDRPTVVGFDEAAGLMDRIVNGDTALAGLTGSKGRTKQMLIYNSPDWARNEQRMVRRDAESWLAQFRGQADDFVVVSNDPSALRAARENGFKTMHVGEPAEIEQLARMPAKDRVCDYCIGVQPQKGRGAGTGAQDALQAAIAANMNRCIK